LSSGPAALPWLGSWASSLQRSSAVTHSSNLSTLSQTLCWLDGGMRRLDHNDSRSGSTSTFHVGGAGSQWCWVRHP
jgi:hypothetical protein